MLRKSQSPQDAPARLGGRLLSVVPVGRLLLLNLCLPGAALAQQFSEVATSAGIASPEGGISMAWGDYDGDLDLYLTTRRENRLYRNNGNGRFTEVAASAGVDHNGGPQALWGDYDGDGDLDLLILDEGFNLLFPESKRRDLRGCGQQRPDPVRPRPHPQRSLGRLRRRRRPRFQHHQPAAPVTQQRPGRFCRSGP